MRRRKPIIDDLDGDIREHIEMETQDNIERGMPPEAARFAALRKFGNVARVMEDTRAVWSFVWLEQLAQDIRVGLRMLRKSPGFLAVTVLTLALGIGVNTAIFSLINAVMLRSLPAGNPSRLVLLKWSARRAPETHSYQSAADCPNDLGPGVRNASGCSFSQPMFREITQANVFSGTAAFANAGRLNLTGNGPASVIYAQLVSGDFFRTMGLQPAIGRLLDPADDTPSAASVAVLNYGYWQSNFGGDPSVVGRTIELNNVPFTIAGVAGQRFTGITPGSDYDVWLPLSDGQRLGGSGPFRWNGRDADAAFWWLTIIGRLKPDMPPQQAQAVVSGLFRNQMLHGSVPLFHGAPPSAGNQPASLPAPQRATPPGGPRPSKLPGAPMALSTAADNPQLTLVPAQSGLTGSRTRYSDPLYVLMLAVGIILLIACANVAGLMLARSAARHKEMAVRLALGAGRTRIGRQLLTESLMIAALGGMLGVLLAWWGAQAIVSFVSSSQLRPLGFAAEIDMRVLGFTVAISVITGILFGIAPAFRSARVDLTPTLKEGEASPPSWGFGSGKWLTMGKALVVAQVALAVVVLVGAGLMVRTLQNLRSVDIGFDSRNVLIFGVNPTLLGYQGRQVDKFYRDLRGRLAETPGVKSASYSIGPPLSGGLMITTFHWPGTPPDQESAADAAGVGPNFFETMGIPILAGRGFNASDFVRSASSNGPAPTSSPAPVIVNQAFVQKYLGQENPLGKQFGQSAGSAIRPASSGYEIVGVVRDTKSNSLRREIHAMIYSPQSAGGASFELRTAADPRAMIPAIRATVAQADANLPLFDVQTESEQIDRLLFQERLVARLASFFGALALALACIGLYGLLSYEVRRRTREIGIRMALGGQSEGVLRLVVRQGLALTLAGAAIGIGVALAVTRYLTSMLYDVHADDPLTIVAVTTLLALVALAACYIPARRAMRVDPMVALRYE